MKQFGNVLPNGLKVSFLAHLFYLFSQARKLKEVYKSITQGIYKAEEGKKTKEMWRVKSYLEQEKNAETFGNRSAIPRQTATLSHTLPRVKMFKSGSVVGLR
jgi:hypothetical protein